MNVLIMTNKQQNDFEGRFFGLLDDTLKGLHASIDEVKKEVRANTNLTHKVHEQAKATNGRVTKLEAEVFNKVKPSDLPAIWKDPVVVRLVLGIVLVIILALTGIRIAGLTQ